MPDSRKTPRERKSFGSEQQFKNQAQSKFRNQRDKKIAAGGTSNNNWRRNQDDDWRPRQKRQNTLQQKKPWQWKKNTEVEKEK